MLPIKDFEGLNEEELEEILNNLADVLFDQWLQEHKLQ